ncbi:MAG: hypothetical protein L6416_02425 [Candidatus Omnitrophica bacterium]|nr:hypothetical protein [Candidatus Omnitrophota bacterium]
MIACIIIGVLVSLAVPAYMTCRLRTEEQKAIATLYSFAQGQKAYWFDQNPNTYTAIISNLTPSYVDVSDDEKDWAYSITAGDAVSFTLLARHKDRFGAFDGLELTIDQDWIINRIGAWPYTVHEAD